MEPEQTPSAGIGFRIVIGLLALTVAIIAFTAINRASDKGAPVPDQGRAPTLTLLARNLPLFEGARNATRIGFEPSGEAVRVNVRFTPDTARVALCPLADMQAPLPRREACRQDIFSGVRQELQAAGLGGVALILSGGGATAHITLEYDDAGRTVDVAIPLLPAPAGASACKDNDCNPFFELRPVRKGAFSATASFTGSDATLFLQQGSVLARSFTATGVPYIEPARASGPSPLSIDAALTANAEYAFGIRHEAGADALTDIRLSARWPT